jgi:hypothetical protein
MSDESETQSDTLLESIDRATLTPLVRQALGIETVDVADHEYREIRERAGGAEGVYRFTGSGCDRGETIPWSLILKIVRFAPDRDDPADCAYWKREVLAYQSGLVDDLPGGLAAPRCFGVVEQPGGQFWLWLEEVRDDIGPRWPLEHYGVVARHLGQFNGAYVMGKAIPCEPWLSRDWLRVHFSATRPGVASGIARLREAFQRPLVHSVYPPSIAESVFRLWTQRDALLDALDRLPQTFCHMDAFRRNLFARQSADGRGQTVAIDWSYVGTGAIGEEIGALVGMSLLWEFQEIGWDRAPELDRIVFDGYLEGLREAGWRGDPRLARSGYTVASALRCGVVYTWWVVSVLLDEDECARWAQIMGCPMQEFVDHLAEWIRFSVTLGDEARELLDEL